MAVSNPLKANLQKRNIKLGAKRTSLTLETAIWAQLDDILQREGLDQHSLCDELDARRGDFALAQSVRIFVMIYFKIETEILSADMALREKSADQPHGRQHNILMLALKRFASISDTQDYYGVGNTAL